MATIEVSVHSRVRPTEIVEKVVLAIENIFPGLSMDIQDDRIDSHGGIESLNTFHKLLREQRILDTSRSVMLHGRLGESIQFRINKQAALMGKINFPLEEEPLGSIHVQITGDDQVMEWLAPRTENGVPVQEIAATEEARCKNDGVISNSEEEDV